MYDDPQRPPDAPLAPSIDLAPPALTPGRTDGGSALPGPVQAKMERSFGADFSDVRVHEGPQAPGRGALAYAQGADVFFAPGRYDPHGAAGQELLGHELAHVVQHAEGRAPGAQAKGAGGDATLEAEADAMGGAAARGELARPGAAHVRATRGPGAIQRMIDKAAPVAHDWGQISAYLDATLINNRKQTFRQAVEEYLACGLAPDDTVADAWQDLEDNRDEDGWEATALARIATIRTAINTHKRDEPDHPNKRGIGPTGERYETIPQSERSQAVAAELRDELLAKMFGGQYDARAHTFNRRALGRDEKWSTSFMLGALVLPDGTVQVAHSGFLSSVQSAAFKRIVEAKGYRVVLHDSDGGYTALQKTYKDALARDSHAHRLPPNVGAQVDKHDRHKHKVIHWGARAPIEKGNPTGVCAAPQVLQPVDGETSEFPGWIRGDGQLALTEVLVRVENKSVTVLDNAQTAQTYDHSSVDVPSCLTCQHQLRELMTKLVNLRRNVVHLGEVRLGEGERDALYSTAWELRDLVEDGRAATIVLGQEQVTQHYSAQVERKIPVDPRKPRGKKKTVWQSEPRTRLVLQDRAPMADGNDAQIQTLLARLEDEIDGYRYAVQTQAIERTTHPEFVERGHRVVPGLDHLEDAEDDAEREFKANRFKALWTRRLAVGRMIGADRYATERERASQSMKWNERAVLSNQARDARSEREAEQREKAEDALREWAGKEALESSQARDARSEQDAERRAEQREKGEDALRERAGKEALESSQARDARSEQDAERRAEELAKSEDALRERAGKEALESSQARDARSEQDAERRAEELAKTEDALRERAGKDALVSSQARNEQSEQEAERREQAEHELRAQAAKDAERSSSSRETLGEVQRIFQLALALAQALDAQLTQAIQGATGGGNGTEDDRDDGVEQL